MLTKRTRLFLPRGQTSDSPRTEMMRRKRTMINLKITLSLTSASSAKVVPVPSDWRPDP